MFDFHVLFTPKPTLMNSLGFKKILSPNDFSEKGEKGKIKLIEGTNEHEITKGALIFPISGKKLTSDPKMVKTVAEKKAAFEIPFSPIFDMDEDDTATYLRSAKKLLQLCVKYHTLYIITSRARNEYELKTPQDLISFGICLGLTPDQAKSAISEYPEIFEKAIFK